MKVRIENQSRYSQNIEASGEVLSLPSYHEVLVEISEEELESVKNNHSLDFEVEEGVDKQDENIDNINDEENYSEDENYICEECESEFDTERGLNVHKGQSHSNTEEN